MRAWLVAPKGAPLARALTSVIVDRATAFGVLLPIAWLGVAIGGDEIPGSIVVLLAIVTAASAAGALVAIVLLRRRGLGRFLPAAMRPWAAEVADTLRRYGSERERMAEVVFARSRLPVPDHRRDLGLSESLGLDIGPELIAVVAAARPLRDEHPDLDRGLRRPRGRLRGPARRGRRVLRGRRAALARTAPRLRLLRFRAAFVLLVQRADRERPLTSGGRPTGRGASLRTDAGVSRVVLRWI